MLGGAGIEAGIDALGQPRDVAEDGAGLGVVAFVKHEGRHAEQRKPARLGRGGVGLFLERIADIDQRADLGLARLGRGVGEHAAELGEAAAAGDVAHAAREHGGGRRPVAGAEFATAAEIDELHREPADRVRDGEHVALDLGRLGPGRLAAQGRVDREDQPPLGLRQARHLGGAAEEGVDVPRGRRLCRKIVAGHDASLTPCGYRNEDRRFPGPDPKLAVTPGRAKRGEGGPGGDTSSYLQNEISSIRRHLRTATPGSPSLAALRAARRG